MLEHDAEEDLESALSAKGERQAERMADAAEPVLLIGHQPTLGFVASVVLAGFADSWPTKKGAARWPRQRSRDGDTQFVLQAIQSLDCL